mgnify:CR=1 FL=1
MCTTASRSGKRGENEEEERVEADKRVPLSYERMNGEVVGVNNKFNLLIKWRVGEINIWRVRFGETIGNALRGYTGTVFGYGLGYGELEAQGMVGCHEFCPGANIPARITPSYDHVTCRRFGGYGLVGSGATWRGGHGGESYEDSGFV